MLHLPVRDVDVPGGCTVSGDDAKSSFVLHCEAAADTAFEAVGLICLHVS